MEKIGAFLKLVFRRMTFLFALATISLHENDVQAQDARPYFGAKGTSINYTVIGSQPNEEELAIKRKVFGIFFTGVNIRRQNAAGLNICATSDSNVGYAFFKDVAYQLDLKQMTITHAKPSDIGTKLYYQVRFEARDNKPLGEILVLNAPDIGSGPKDPCSIQ
jgi:hypothetical protein